METSAQYRETSAQYREFAEECDRLAKQAKTDGERKILEEMAEAWRKVAGEALALSRLFFVSLVYVFFCQTKPHLCHVSQQSPRSLIFGVAR
ncbi:MAG: hypothetical protein WBX95_10575 [Xanthobacteraceae bacterium]